MATCLTKDKTGFTARFERNLNHPIENVWSMLTENDQLKKWFPELSIEDLRKDGIIKFDMQDGTFEEMKILDLEAPFILEYTWGEDKVRFELQQNPEGCRLVMIEKLNGITSHTPRDLAGWHVCLDVIETLLDGKDFSRPQEIWEKYFKEYNQTIEDFLKKIQS